MSEADGRPLQLVRGNPTEEELAALVVTLRLLQRPGPEPGPAQQPNSAGWAARWRGVRQPLHPGAGAWRAAGRPD